MKKLINMAAIVIMAITFTSCANMPTNPTQITGAYTSDIVYVHLKCDQLATEFNHLSRRESKLNLAQEQRIKTSNMQAFWLGYGTGDGIEASELSEVRGDIDAVRRVMENKHCKQLAYMHDPMAERMKAEEEKRMAAEMAPIKYDSRGNQITE